MARLTHPLPGEYFARAPRSERQDSICEEIETPGIDAQGATEAVAVEASG